MYSFLSAMLLMRIYLSMDLILTWKAFTCTIWTVVFVINVGRHLFLQMDITVFASVQ